jgi:TorA maturation chaperone TorD
MAEQQRSQKQQRSRSKASSGTGNPQKKKKRRSRSKGAGGGGGDSSGGGGGGGKSTLLQKALDQMPGADQEKYVKKAAARADLYEIFSIFFQQTPTTEILAIFKHSDFMGILKIVLGEEHQQQWKKFYNSSTPLESFQIRLQREYNNLFLVPTSQRFIPKETAFYFDPNNKAAQKQQLDSLLKFYRRIGLTPMAKFKDQPDHLSQMMHYMNVVGEREKDHLKKKNASQLETACKLQKEFVHHHLAPWIPKFKERLYQATRFQFLRQIADTLEAFILQDAEWTAAMPQTYGFPPPEERQKKSAQKQPSSAESGGKKGEGKPGGGRSRRRRRRRSKKTGDGNQPSGQKENK